MLRVAVVSAVDKLSATPQGFRYQSVLELDPLRLASASQMMGGAEQYLQSLFERLKADPSVLLYIGDLSLLKPLGRTGGEVLEALFVGLARRRMQCIAHATPATYSQSVERSEAASLQYGEVPSSSLSRVKHSVRPTSDAVPSSRITTR